MRLSNFFSVLIFCIIFFTAGNVLAQITQKGAKPYNCGTDRSGTLFCQRTAPAGKYDGQEGIYKENIKGKVCAWKCKVNGGLETCKADGPECQGKYPPHWR
ncbi:MAG: hypothetical protein ABFD12_00285 [Syntrophorhabdus sp.]